MEPMAITSIHTCFKSPGNDCEDQAPKTIRHKSKPVPIASMYGIFCYLYLPIYMKNHSKKQPFM